MKSLFLLPLFFILLSTNAQPPTIGSFAPTSGPIGTTVTIAGTNFSPNAADNIVYFGAVKAPVTIATSSSLTVTVPLGATYKPITVTTNSLTAYTNRAFVVTFGNNQSNFSSTSFAAKVDFQSTANSSIRGALDVYDFDGDGKPDIVVSGSSLSIFRNTSTGGTISFANRIEYLVGGSWQLAVGDLNGDGKLDIAAADDALHLLINTSTVGNISFNVIKNFQTGSYRGVAITDLDGDGKPDLSAGEFTGYNQKTGFVSIFKNISSGPTVTFGPKTELTVSNGTYNVFARDLDGDLKPDLEVLHGFGQGADVFRNTSTPGTISFTPAGSAIGGNFYDLNCDGKPDLVSSGLLPSGLSSNPPRIYVFKNESAMGSINFQSAINRPLEHSASSFDVGDIDGDGRPDLALSISPDTVGINSNSFTLFRNISSNGSISLDSEVKFGTQKASSIAVGDLDGDGYPDIIITDDVANQISVYRNQLFCTPPTFSNSEQIVLDANCDKMDGSISIFPTGGFPPFQYSINGGTTYILGPDGGYTFTNLAPGEYQLRLKDAKGCESAILSRILKAKRNCQLEPFTLYGVTYSGGTNNKGVLFSYNLQSGNYTKLKDFNGTDGKEPSGALVQAYNNILYGTITADYSEGKIFSYDPASKTYTILKDFSGSPVSRLVEAENHKLYGMSSRELFSFDPVLNTYTKLVAFTSESGSGGEGMTKGTDGKLYGYTFGTFFSFDPTSNVFTNLKYFNGFGGLDGRVPQGVPLQASDGKFYGITFNGGANNRGVIFSFDPVSLTYTKLKDFSSSEGFHYSGFIQATDGKLYSFSSPSTDSEKGTIFSFDNKSNTYTERKVFTGLDGSNPFGDLMQASNGKLYGMTDLGGINNLGVIFSFDPTNDTYTKLKDFAGIEGANPFNATLIEFKINSACTPPTFLNNAQTVVNATCGRSNGSISIVPASGTAPFMYSINGGIKYVAGPDNGYTFSNLAAGTYKLRMKDALGCESAIVEKILTSIDLNCAVCTPPTFLNNNQIVLDATCGKNDGNISIIPTSGTAPFMYSINGGSTYVSGPNSGYTFMNLSAATYKLRLKDANGCESVLIERMVKSIDCPTCTPPTFLNNQQIVLDANCGKNDGNIYIIPTNGTAPFMYSIDGGLTYVSGPNGGYTFNNLSPGTYKLRLKDATGCQSAIVEKTVNQNKDCPLMTIVPSPGHATGIAEMPAYKAEVVLTYPNPSKGQFRLQLQNFISPKAEVSIFDGKGTLVEKRWVNAGEGSATNFNLSGYSKGMYYIKIVTGKGTKSAKILIQ